MQRSRRAATFVWAAMVVVALAFLALALDAREPAAAAHADLLFWVATGASALDLALAWALPPRLRWASSDPSVAALGRLVVAWALCEAAALGPVVVYFLTRDARLLGGLAAGLLALVVLAPTDARWRSVLPAAARGELGRMVR